MGFVDDITDALGDPDKLKAIGTILGAAVSLGTLAFKAIEDLKADEELPDAIPDTVLMAAAEESRTLAAIARKGLVTEPKPPLPADPVT
jgi:hypothetical protein